MKKIVLLSILLYSVCSNAVGQAPSKSSLENAQYQIIRATVDFLATDHKFGNNAPCTICKDGDYEALKKYATDSQLTGVLSLINDWKKINLDTTEARWEDSLIVFKNKVYNKITSKDKKYRQNFKEHNNYKGRLDSIVNSLKPVAKPQNVSEQSPMLGSSEEKKTVGGEMNSEEPMFTLLNIVLFSLIITLLGLFLFINKNNKKRVKRDRKNFSEEKRALDSTAKHLKQNIDNLEDQKKNLEEKVIQIEAELAAEREKTKIFAQRQAQQIAPEQKISQSLQAETKIRYASYADQGDGFSASSLFNQSNSETIFEIALTSQNTATFKISNNSNAQRYALSNAAYFLGTTCKYDVEPTNQQSIVTEKAGELKLQGNKWVITTQAIISFR